MVNSKTKTALANLLNNRLQGNSTGTDCSSTTTSTSSTVVVVSSASTTHTMCPPSQIPPVPSSQSHQLPLQHPVTQATSQSLNVVNQRRTLSNLTNGCKTIHQVNSYGAAAAARTGVVNQSPASIAISPTRTQFYGHEPTFKGTLFCALIVPTSRDLGIHRCVDHKRNKIRMLNGEKLEVNTKLNIISLQHQRADFSLAACFGQHSPWTLQLMDTSSTFSVENWLPSTTQQR